MAAGLTAPTIVRSAESADWGDLVGKFVYDGKAPERKKLKVDKDVECCGKFDIRDESLMVGDDGGLGNVYVYLRTKDVKVCPELEKAVKAQVVLDNRDCIFIPHCMTIWHSKQEFLTINSDPVGQTVTFTPIGDLPFNKVLPVGGKATYRFNRAQRVPIPINCVYHKWELAYVLPSDNPYVAISKKDGTFSIPKLPAGELEFQVWHERVGYLKTPSWKKGRFEMTIKPGVNDLGTIKLAPSVFEKKS